MDGFRLTHNSSSTGHFMVTADKLVFLSLYVLKYTVFLTQFLLCPHVPKYSDVCLPPLVSHLYVRVLWVNVSIGQVWKVLEIQDEGFSLFLRLRLWENTNWSVLVMGPPPLVAVGLRQKSLNLVLLLQSLRGILDPTAVNQVAINLKVPDVRKQ